MPQLSFNLDCQWCQLQGDGRLLLDTFNVSRQVIHPVIYLGI